MARKDSPAIKSTTPDWLRCCGSPESDDPTVVLEGSGFTKHSEVKFGDDPYTHGAVTFVSSNELNVAIPMFKLQGEYGFNSRTTPLILTVVNGPLQLSAPAELHVLPSAKFRPEPSLAVIRAITPYPVPMMDWQSPHFITLEISGDNFRPNDWVAIDNKVSGRTHLKTRYISPHRLEARLPRDLWRKHRLSFRLIIQTSAGFCAAEAFEDSLE